MTEPERIIWRRLQRVTMPVASYDKRFRRNIGEAADLTEKQARYLRVLDHRYRRQLVGEHICSEECATFGRRQTGECFDAPLPPKPVPVTRRDATFLRSLNISPTPHAELPLFDERDNERAK